MKQLLCFNTTFKFRSRSVLDIRNCADAFASDFFYCSSESLNVSESSNDKSEMMDMDRKISKQQIELMLIVLLIGSFVQDVFSEDITKAVLDAEYLNGYPVAYGDFNSDEMTDVFFLTEERDGHYLKILFGSEEPPLLKDFNVSCRLSGPSNHENIENEQKQIYFMVGDFDGDGALDVLRTHQSKKKKYTSFIYYGDTNKLHCDSDHKFESIHHPIAIDYNDDLIIDFLTTVVKQNQTQTKIVTNIKRKQQFVQINLFGDKKDQVIAEPVRSSYVDIDGNKYADLVIATNTGIDVCNSSATRKLECRTLANYPNNINSSRCGEMVFVDLGLTGKFDVLLPCCIEPNKCDIYLLKDDGSFISLNLTFNFIFNWTFLTEGHDVPAIFNRTIYLRQVDFNMDGYPDFLVNLINEKQVIRTVLIENVPYDGTSLINNRRLLINWNGFSFLEGAISASVFDSSQNGNLDIFAVFRDGYGSNYKTKVFKHVMNENINFLKILVLSGKQNTSLTNKINVNKKMKYYGTPNIGTSISYHRLTQEGIEEKSTAVQNQKSTYMALELQYVIFGLGKTPEFVDNLIVSLNGQSKSWSLNIPNSQVVVLTIEPKDPKYWIIKLFVTPSKLILYSLISLIGVGLALSVLIGALHWRERQEDKKERLMGPHFHFDAM